MNNSAATLQCVARNQNLNREINLSLQEPKLNEVDLGSCPDVLEDAYYKLILCLDVAILQQALLDYLKEQDTTPHIASEDSDTEPTGTSLARHDLNEYEGQILTLDSDQSIKQCCSLVDGSGYFKNIKCIKLLINDKEYSYFDTLSAERTSFTAKLVNPDKYKRQANPNNDDDWLQIFLLQYDMVILSVVIRLQDDSVLTLYSSVLLCASQNKSDNRNISQILTELISMPNDTILELMFIQQKKQENLNSNFFGGHRTFQPLRSYVKLLEQVLSCYRDNYNYFRNLARHMLVKAEVVTAFDQVRMLTHKSQRWLTQNLQVLSEVVPQQAAISYLDKNYLPLQMQSTTTVKSYDTYENRVVVGFLQMVLHNACKIALDYKTFLYEHLDALKALRAKFNERGHSYEVPIITLKLLHFQNCEKTLNHLYEVIGDLSSIYRNYTKLFELKDVLLKQLPRKAKAFQEIKPYAQVFYTINRWFKYGEFSLQKDMLFLQGNTLDKLFEYYCLYRLLDMLIKAGFTPSTGEASYLFSYPKNAPNFKIPHTKICPNGNTRSFSNGVSKKYQYNDPIANTYVLKRGKQKVTLYYQPYISDEAFYNQIFAFRTHGVNSDEAIPHKYNFYTPDFILKFSSDENFPGNDDYVILDAKYSNRKNVLKHYIQNLISKYVNNIAVLRRKDSLARDKYYDQCAPSEPTLDVNFDYQSDAKPPRMLVALYGRVTAEGEFDANAAPRYWWPYHDTPLARFIIPSTNIGSLELKANDRATEFLWAELTRTLPYLEQSSKKAPPADQTA